MITRSDTVASPLRSSEEAPSSGFAWRKPAEPRELEPYTARLTEPELLPTSDDPTVVDQGLARSSLRPPARDRVSVTPSRMSLTPSRLSLTPSRMSITPSRVLEPTVSLAAPRVPSDRTHGAAQDPNAAVPPSGRARGVDYWPWLLVCGTTLGAAAIGAGLGYATRPKAGITAAPAAETAAARVTPRATATPPAERSAPVAPPERPAAPAATSTVPVIRLGELPVAAPAAPDVSAEPDAPVAPASPPAGARHPAPRPTARHR